MRVAIVDDHPIIRHGIRRLLECESDITIVGEASSSGEIGDLLAKNETDVVVLDLSMAGISGFEALTRIKEKHPSTSVLILSIHPEEQYAIRAMKAGASGYLNKECAPELLVDAIRKIFRGEKHMSEKVQEMISSRLAKGKTQTAHELLSEREFQVFLGIGKGLPLREIAKSLELSEKTVSTYRERVLKKINMNTNSEIIQYAFKNQLLE